MNGKVRYAHRLAWEAENGPIPDGIKVDHKCHNRACVRTSHMQLVNNAKNLENRAGLSANNKSGVRGVCWYRALGKWHAQVKKDGRTHHVGYFDDLYDAARAVIAKRNELFTNNLIDRGIEIS